MPLVVGQSLKIVRGTHSYFIRCLPSDFPSYSATVNGTPQAPAVLVTPTLSTTAGVRGNYVVVFDAHGVPVWWFRDATGGPLDAKFFGPSTIGWWSGGAFHLYGLNGVLGQNFTAGGGALDNHDFQLMPNGNYLGIIYAPRDNVDLSSWGLSSQAQIVDSVIVELDPNSQIVWSWSAADHVDVAASNVNFRANFPDVVHMNSIQYVGSGQIVFSARHLDAVYKINMSTGAIMWKLGGTPTPKSLTAIGDQYATANPAALFSGQHDARLSNGQLTLQDNGTTQSRPVRALRFAINGATRTATELEQVTDARFNAAAFCCGGVARLSSGHWLASWGTADYVTELTPLGAPVLTISYGPYFSYRVATVPASIASLRNGMDAMVAPLQL
ncbi:MAG TPA: arylsulfotransferase family protein [Acidimicrobiia bacterium]|nr:arylsulfotransferase family protein [Acidimicrobiia bacterium]